jgi:TetR/AcrR family transcriptional repressor of mexJK operon
MTHAPKSKRQSILAAARQAFLAHGYSGASMEAIAEAAPVSKPTLYSHFRGKQDLFAAVIAEQCESLLGTLARSLGGNRNPEEGLKAIARAFVDLIYAPESLQLYRLIISEQQHFPDLGLLVYRSGPEPVLKQLAAYLAELAVGGALKIVDVEGSSRLFLSMLKGDEHFRCLLGLQDGLNEGEKDSMISAAVAFFLKGHGYEA